MRDFLTKRETAFYFIGLAAGLLIGILAGMTL